MEKASSRSSQRFIVGEDILYKKTRKKKEEKKGERSVHACLAAEWVGIWFPRTSFNPFKVHQKYCLSMFIRNVNFFPEGDYALCNRRRTMFGTTVFFLSTI